MTALPKRLLEHVLPRIARPLQILWNQIIGFFFVVLALAPIPAAYRSYRDPNGLPRFVMEVFFIVIMAGFGLSSFWRARKVARS